MPVNTPPTSTSLLTRFESPVNQGDNFGERVQGYICAPETGTYTFWISSDQITNLYMSTDENPANKVEIAYVVFRTNLYEWTKYAKQKSAPINLIAGKKYYIEVLHREHKKPITWTWAGIRLRRVGLRSRDYSRKCTVALYVTRQPGRVRAEETTEITTGLAVYPNPFSETISIDFAAGTPRQGFAGIL